MCVCVWLWLWLPGEYISLWAGVFTIFWCLCWFDLGLIACGNTVVHAHITYVLKSCCFSLSLFNLFTLCLSADLPSVPFSLLICTIPSSFLPPVERTACGAQRQKKARQAQDLTERIQRPPGPVEQPHKHTLPLENRESTSHTHAPAHTDRVTHIFIFFYFPTQSPLLLFWPYLLSLFISSGPASFPLSTDVFEDDISSCSSSPNEQHGVHQSPAFSSLSGLSGDQLMSDFSAVGPPLNHSPSHAQVRKPCWDLAWLRLVYCTALDVPRQSDELIPTNNLW